MIRLFAPSLFSSLPQPNCCADKKKKLSQCLLPRCDIVQHAIDVYINFPLADILTGKKIKVKRRKEEGRRINKDTQIKKKKKEIREKRSRWIIRHKKGELI